MMEAGNPPYTVFDYSPEAVMWRLEQYIATTPRQELIEVQTMLAASAEDV